MRLDLSRLRASTPHFTLNRLCASVWLATITLCTVHEDRHGLLTEGHRLLCCTNLKHIPLVTNCEWSIIHACLTVSETAPRSLKPPQPSLSAGSKKFPSNFVVKFSMPEDEAVGYFTVNTACVIPASAVLPQYTGVTDDIQRHTTADKSTFH